MKLDDFLCDLRLVFVILTEVWMMKLLKTTLINNKCSPNESKWGECPPFYYNELSTVHLLPAVVVM